MPAASNVTVMLTSAGVATAVNVISALRRPPGPTPRILAVDMNPYAAGLHLADAWRLVPSAADPDYEEILLDICHREGVSFVFPLHSSEIERMASAAPRFRATGVAMMTPTPETARLCADKQAFLDFLAREEFRFPQTLTLPLAETPAFPLFLKPRSGSSSRGTFRIDDDADLAYLLAKNPDSILQEYVAGTEYTVDCLADRGQLLACVPRVRVSVKDGKTVVGRTVEHPKLRALVADLLERLEMHGPCNAQVIEDGGGQLFVIEINPRLAAGGLTLAVQAGANIPAMMLALAQGRTVAPADYRRGLVMIRFPQDIFLTERPQGPTRLP